MSMEEIYYDEATPFTEEDYRKLVEAFKQYGLQYKRLMYGSWVTETEQERKLRELAETYHTGCEAYDKRVCTGTYPKTGEAMPLTPDEMGLINRHAREMREGMVAEGERVGLTRRQVEEAIRKYIPGR